MRLANCIFTPEWKKCPCGDTVCKREYISNLGTFFAGSGFDPEEKKLINAAFEALAREKEPAPITSASGFDGRKS